MTPARLPSTCAKREQCPGQSYFARTGHAEQHGVLCSAVAGAFGAPDETPPDNVDAIIELDLRLAQFVSLSFGQKARAAEIAQSMGSKGDCYDNAVAESFFATLK